VSLLSRVGSGLAIGLVYHPRGRTDCEIAAWAQQWPVEPLIIIITMIIIIVVVVIIIITNYMA
jgi:hypothetical protein